jgi:hypothetical protein
MHGKPQQAKVMPKIPQRKGIGIKLEIPGV